MKKNLSLELIKEARKSARKNKISELVRRAIAGTFQLIDFTSTNGKAIIFLVSKVELSRDGKSAKVFISDIDYNNDYEENFYLELLNSKIHKINKEFSSKIDLRYTPKLYFKYKKTQVIWKSRYSINVCIR